MSDFQQKLQQRRKLVTPYPPSRHNDCLDKKYVPCRENILHHGRKLEIFDVLAGYFLLVKSTQFTLQSSPPIPSWLWETRSDVFIHTEQFSNIHISHFNSQTPQMLRWSCYHRQVSQSRQQTETAVLDSKITSSV